MEWVETTGRTTDEAKDTALDQLGVDETDAEFEILEEAKAGLFGRVRREARVRARIRPTRPRPKPERRERRKRGNGRARGDKTGATSSSESRDRGDRGRSSDTGGGAAVVTADQDDKPRSSGPKRRRPQGGDMRPKASGGGQDQQERNQGDKAMTTEVSLEEQAEIVEDFLDGLIDAFDLDGDVVSERIDDDTLEVQVNGDDLGLLIGPKGQTLAAIQELSRTIVQRKAQGSTEGRLRVDVSGYRQRRSEALERFARTVAEDVKSSGAQKALEPMGSADRKVVHDTINDIDGVVTTSEGEEPRRRVVILPE
jgi:spoIIIJ-associated protein